MKGKFRVYSRVFGQKKVECTLRNDLCQVISVRMKSFRHVFVVNQHSIDHINGKMYLKALWALILKIYWGEHCFFTLASLLYMSFNKDSIWCTPVLGFHLHIPFILFSYE